MPYVKIYATAGRSPEQKRELMEAVHQGMVDGAGIPEWDRQVRLFEFGPDNILLPEQDDAASYVLIEVTGYPRSLEVKRELYQAIVKHVAGAGVDPDDTKIVYFDVPPDSWGLMGGQAGSDIMAKGSDTGWQANY